VLCTLWPITCVVLIFFGAVDMAVDYFAHWPRKGI